MTRFALFDYGAGNLHSLGKALEGAGAAITVTSDWEEALELDALVLPGVGAFGRAASSLPEDPSAVRSALVSGLPCLGICLGMQLLFASSEESLGEGIGLIDGTVRMLPTPVVPQMGWNDVQISDDPLFRGIDGLVAYYANSYVCYPSRRLPEIAWSEYGGHRFVAGVRSANSWGVQFHPEKSSSAGRGIIANFVALATAIARERGDGGSQPAGDTEAT